VATHDSHNLKFKNRGGDNFIFTPLVCGSSATGYVAAKQCRAGKIDLGTAFTISGAAVDPNTGATRSRPQALLMALFNIRLGYWIRNPARPSGLIKNLTRPIWHVYMLCEMLGFRLNERRRYVHLSDGGHFENLGLYELVRRKCRYIFVSDAGADPEWTFEDLANACEKVRVDFGADIIIDSQPLHPKGDLKLSDKAYVVGTVNYHDGSSGKILYIKTTLIPGLPEDIYGYQRAHRSFPDEPTSDQFFSEEQFEAYRELGFQVGRSIFKIQNRTLANIFSV
jgi:hypothetical protein